MSLHHIVVFVFGCMFGGCVMSIIMGLMSASSEQSRQEEWRDMLSRIERRGE